MTINNNFILNTDSYKTSHWLQYPNGTTNVFMYGESRGGVYPVTVVAGLQPYLKEYLVGEVVTTKMIDDAEKFLKAHGEPFNREGWEYIVRVHKGRLPLRIKAVPEGSIVPTHNVLVTVEATDPNCFWLPSYIETGLLRALWYMTTVATISWDIKQLIIKYLEETGDPSLINFKLHDFGARGVSSKESAGLGGAAHLINFMGSDTIEGIRYAMHYYNTDDMVAFSIPAAEHSTMTALGCEGEVAQMRRMLETFGKPAAMFACVSDSYDIKNAVTNIWGKELRQQVIDSGAVLVVRPDSGKPADVVLECVKELDTAFGSTINTKGYRVLNPCVRVIQGDGINRTSIREILFGLKINGYSADNIAFGMGGALLQQMNRDTQQFAMKASAMEINGVWHDVFKDPITDPGKKSKRGRLGLYLNNGEYVTDKEHLQSDNQLVLVFENGEIIKEWTFSEVRQRANNPYAARR